MEDPMFYKEAGKPYHSVGLETGLNKKMVAPTTKNKGSYLFHKADFWNLSA